MNYLSHSKRATLFALSLMLSASIVMDSSQFAIAQGRPDGPPRGFDGRGFGGPGGGPGRGPEGRGRGGMMGGPGFRRSEKMQLAGFLRGIGELEKAKKTPLNKKQAQKIVTTIAPWRKKAAMSDADAKTLFAALQNTLTAPQKSALQTMRPYRPQDFGGRRGERRGPGGFGGDRDGRPGGRRDGPPRGERPNGPPPGGFGGPGGPPPGSFGRGPGGDRGNRPAPPTEAQMKKMEAFVKTFNPFYPPTSYKQLKELPRPMQEGMQRRYKETQDVLSQLTVKAKK